MYIYIYICICVYIYIYIYVMQGGAMSLDVHKVMARRSAPQQPSRRAR